METAKSLKCVDNVSSIFWVDFWEDCWASVSAKFPWYFVIFLGRATSFLMRCPGMYSGLPNTRSRSVKVKKPIQSEGVEVKGGEGLISLILTIPIFFLESPSIIKKVSVEIISTVAAKNLHFTHHHIPVIIVNAKGQKVTLNDETPKIIDCFVVPTVEGTTCPISRLKGIIKLKRKI